MKQIICDRCGKVINYSQGMPVYAITRPITSEASEIMDICNACRTDLINFMHGGIVVDADYFEKSEAENDR